MKFILAAITATFATGVWAADVTKASPLSVAETADALEAAIADVGATLFARVDHAAGAESVDRVIPEAQLLIFGNPALGTAALEQDIRAGLVLPLRVLVFEDGDGSTQLLWASAEDIFDGFDIAPDAEVVGRINDALDNLTDAAIAAD